MIAPKEKRPEFSAVVAAVPVSGVAARVVSRGVHWEPAKKVDETFFRSDAPPPTRPVSFSDPSHDLTGQVFGDLRVIGAWRDKQGKRGHTSWVCRCTCGYYENRKAKSLKEQPRERLCCSHCGYLRDLKAGRVPPRTLQDIAGRP